MNAAADIYEYIVTNLFQGDKPVDFNNDYNLINDGAMDSLAIINLISYLESTHHMELEDRDITPENFASVAALINVVNRRTQQDA